MIAADGADVGIPTNFVSFMRLQHPCCSARLVKVRYL
jgi:hypothetical protein